MRNCRLLWLLIFTASIIQNAHAQRRVTDPLPYNLSHIADRWHYELRQRMRGNEEQVRLGYFPAPNHYKEPDYTINDIRTINGKPYHIHRSPHWINYTGRVFATNAFGNPSSVLARGVKFHHMRLVGGQTNDFCCDAEARLIKGEIIQCDGASSYLVGAEEPYRANIWLDNGPVGHVDGDSITIRARFTGLKDYVDVSGAKRRVRSYDAGQELYFREEHLPEIACLKNCFSDNLVGQTHVGARVFMAGGDKWGTTNVTVYDMGLPYQLPGPKKK